MGGNELRQRVAASGGKERRFLEKHPTSPSGSDRHAAHLAVLLRVPGHSHASAPAGHAHSDADRLLRLLDIAGRTGGLRLMAGLQPGALGGAGRRPALRHGTAAVDRSGFNAFAKVIKEVGGSQPLAVPSAASAAIAAIAARWVLLLDQMLAALQGMEH